MTKPQNSALLLAPANFEIQQKMAAECLGANNLSPGDVARVFDEKIHQPVHVRRRI
jgi:hypothetical protein